MEVEEGAVSGVRGGGEVDRGEEGVEVGRGEEWWGWMQRRW